MSIQPYLPTYYNLLLDSAAPAASLVGEVGFNNGVYTAPTVTRASTVNVLNASNTYTAYGANVVPIYKGIGIWAEPAHTNECIYSNDISSWSSVAVVTAGQTDIWGGTLGCTVEDNAGSLLSRSLVTTVPDDSNNYTWVVDIEKDSDETRFPRFSILLTGGTTQEIHVMLNTETGADDLYSSTGTVDYNIDSYDHWWRVTLTVQNNGTGNTSAVCYIYPAFGTTLGAYSAAATGSINVMNNSMYKNTAHDIARHLSPIVTSGAAVTSDACGDYETGLSLDATSGLHRFGFMSLLSKSELSNVSSTIKTFIDAGTTMYVHPVNDIRMYDGVSNPLYDPSIVAGTEYITSYIYDAGHGKMKLRVNGSWSAETNFDGALYRSPSGTTKVMPLNGQQWLSPCVLTSYQQWSAPSYDLFEAKAEELDA